MTKKYKAGGLSDWWNKKNENEKLLRLKSKLEEVKLELTNLFQQINLSQNLDWVIDLNVVKGKISVTIDSYTEDTFATDEEPVSKPIKELRDCLKITDVVYDQHNLLPKILEFLSLQKEKLEMEKVPDPIDQDNLLLSMIQFIDEQFVKLYAAHKSEKIFHSYIRNVLDKVPQDLINLKFEEKKPEVYINYKTRPEIPDVQTNETREIFELLSKIKGLLPEKFKWNFLLIEPQLFKELNL